MPLTVPLAITASPAQAATIDQLFVVGENTDPLVGAVPLSFTGTAFAVQPVRTGSGTAAKNTGLHITAGTAPDAFDLTIAMKPGVALATGTYNNLGPTPGGSASLTVSNGTTVCAAGTTSRLIIDQVTFSGATLTHLVARWQTRCNGSAAASFGAVSYKRVSPATFRTRVISPAAISFGNQRMGWPSGTKTITVTNNGPNNLVPTKVVLTGSNANEFEIVADRCTWVGLAATRACTVVVRYHPTHALGAHNAALTIFDELSPTGGTGFRVALTGTAVTFRGLYTPVTPTRIADSRTGVGFPLRKITAGTVVNLQVLGRGGVPTTGVSAVVLNVVTANASTTSSVRTWASGTPQPPTSFANPAPFRTRVHQATVQVGSNGKVSFVHTKGTLDLAVDVVGYYAGITGPKGLAYQPVSATNLFDTRAGFGAFPAQPLGSKHSLGFSLLRAFGGDPAALPKVVVLSVSVTDAAATGSLNAFRYDPTKPPSTTYAPGTPVVAFNKALPASNLVTYALNGDTHVWLYNNASAGVNVRVDLVGTFVTPTNGPDRLPLATGRYVPVTPTRIIDTRTAGGAVTAGTTRTITVAPFGTPTAIIPADAVAVAGSITAIMATDTAAVAVYSAAQCPAPTITTLSTLAGFNVPTALLLPLSAAGSCTPTAGQIAVVGTSSATPAPTFHVVVDIVGYYLA